jgi:hypothetical protein
MFSVHVAYSTYQRIVLCRLLRSLRLLIIGKANVLSTISLTMDDFSLKLEVHLAMPIRDIMNAFILGKHSFLCLYNAGHNSRK